MRRLALGVVLLTTVACGTNLSSDGGTQQALLRTAPLATCTANQEEGCPAVKAEPCPAGQEPVIDYSSDCCAHLSCQPICAAPAICSTTPAPVCPVGTHLWIGTAVEDCCPAFRCDPDGTQCDPTKPAACTVDPPVCPGNAAPVVVGFSSECCAIYQCACGGAPPPVTSIPICGCTKPTCKPGESTVCAGTDPCGGPCTCQPQQPQCATNADCPAGEDCTMTCVGWGCAPAAGGSTGACSCPSGDASCQCDSAGSCTGQTCTSECVPVPPACDPMNPIACPMSLPACPGGQPPVVVGTDPASCCPIERCPVCPMTASPIACPLMPVCACAKQIGIDSTNCCPSYICGGIDPTTGQCL